MSILDKASLIQIPSGYKSTKLYSLRPSNGDGDFTFARSSSGTRVNSEGLIETMSANVPRLDYSGGASCASLLLEPQRTNLALYSEQFENAAWSNEGLSLSANDTTSPDGATNADKIIETADNGVHVIYNTSPITASATSTASVFYKKGTRRYFSVKIQIGSNSYTQVFDSEGLTTGGNSSNGLTNVSTKIEDYGNGWVRASVAGTSASGTSTYVIIGLSNSLNPTFHPTNYNPTYEGSGTDYGYAYGAQVEAGSYPTSYIPTTSATVTRTADVCNNAGTSATFNDSEGVLFAEIAALANDSTQRAISLSDGSNTNRVCLLYNDSSNSIRLFVQVGGSTQSSIISTSYTITDSNKIAVKWKENDFALWINGVEVGTDNSGVSFTSNTLNTLDFRFPNDTTFFYGKTKQLMVFNEALSDEELSDLTGQANLSFNNLATFYNYTIL